jgi:hypothetical protein
MRLTWKRGAGDEALEPAPGAVVLGELGRLLGALGLERVDGAADVLGAVEGGDEDRVAHRHGHEARKADAHELEVGDSERSSVSRQSMAVAAPEVRTPSASGPPSRQTASQPPRSDQGASKGTTDRFGSLLHHRVVDRHVARARPGRGREAQEAQVGLGLAQRLGHGVEEVGGVGAHGGQEVAGGEQEDAGVP